MCHSRSTLKTHERDAYDILAYAPEAFGFVNVMFFTLGAAPSVTAARRTLVARFRPDSQRFTASSRLSCKNLDEVSRAATGAETRIPQSRAASARKWARRVMVYEEYHTPFPTLYYMVRSNGPNHAMGQLRRESSMRYPRPAI
jgi:hypothetical protein